MPDVEDHSNPFVGPSLPGCCTPARIRIILHGVVVTALFFVIMFAYLYLYRDQHINVSVDNRYAVASLVIQIIAYLALGCLYLCNSSGWQEKIISAGFLVFVQSIFLTSSIGIPVRTFRVDYVSGTNIVAISSYCAWKLGYIILHRSMIVRTILTGAIVASILAVIIQVHTVNEPLASADGNYQDIAVWLLIQLVAYSAVCCLYICNFSTRKEKIISAGFLVVVLLVVIVLSFFVNFTLRPSLIFWANIGVICFYVALTGFKIYHKVQRCLLDAEAAQPRVSAPQEEAVLLQLTPLRIQQKSLREFTSVEIQSMTQDFRWRIGIGASAQVFRGNLDDGTAVAVKRIHMHSGRTEVGEDEFRSEVSIVANVHHRSLVHLIGYCLQHGGGLYLVYPFFENGSLDSWIFNRSDEQRRLLTWPKSLCIAIDVARALAYLHNECRRRILHLDIKPGNILLDGDLRAHVSDFGISLSITRDLTSVINTRGRGTFGYMAPEMLVNAVSDRSDVFSYGMTLLELISGRKNFDPLSLAMPDPNLARNLLEKMAQGKHMELVDAAMADVDEEAVKTAVKVAICCIQHERDMRPSMQNVVDMLEDRIPVNLQPEASQISEHSAINIHSG